MQPNIIQPQQEEKGGGGGDQPNNLLTLSEKKPRLHKSGIAKEFKSPDRQQSYMIDLSTMISANKKEANSFKSPANQKLNKTSTLLNSTQKTESLSKSVYMSPGQSTNVKVVIRVRPLNDREKALGAQSKTCIQVEDCSKIMLDRGQDLKNFTFDYVAGQESTQEEIFLKIAQPITDSCLQGYNGTIFAYGQTGSGKTFTIQGPSFITPSGDEQLISATNTSGVQLEARGLMQRSFEHIFACIDHELQEAELNSTEIKYLIKSSYLEIYNEQVMDLLDPSATNLHVREDIKTGVYVEGLIEEPISCVKDIMALIQRGSRNRHVGSTAMNKESSRSHSVLTTQIESKTMTAAGVWQMKSSCFHIIDLAGSERSKHTHAEGQRLKEAGMINKSLSALGIVINSLVDISEGKTRHVHYRDSKLTFLLRDSLGGNSKTVIIANITQAQVSSSETMSTLQFAQRAKLIKNKAVINEENSGSIQILKNEIRRLKQEMAEMERVQHEKPTVLPVMEMDTQVCSLCRAEVCQSNSSFNDEMLVESPKPKTPEATKARIAQLENLLSANLDNLTCSHKYFEVEAEKKNLSFKRMQQAMEQLDKQSQRDKMIIKFRDQRIIKLEQTIADSSLECQQCESIKDQVVELAKERDEWKEMYDKQTSTLAAKLFAEKEELRRQNEILTLEIKQTPESLTAQLRGFNELTDSLSQYLKEHFDRSEFELFSEQKLALETQLETLQSKLSQTLSDHTTLIEELEQKHQTSLTQMDQKLQEVHDKSRVEQQLIQQEANQQIAQVKSDLLKLSTESESTIVDKFEGICREQDLQQKLSQQIENYEQLQEQLNKQIQQLTEQLQKQQQANKQNEEQSLEKYNSLLQSQDQIQQKLKSVSLEYDKDVQSLQKQLLIAEANSDSLKDAQSELQESRLKLEVQNEDLLKQQLVSQEEHSQAIQAHLSEVSQIQREHSIKVESLSLQFREQIDQILAEKVQVESQSVLEIAQYQSDHKEQLQQLESKYQNGLQELEKCHSDSLTSLKEDHTIQIEQLSKSHDLTILQTQESHQSFLDQTQKIHQFKIEESQQQHCETLEVLKLEIQNLTQSQSDTVTDLNQKNETLSAKFCKVTTELQLKQTKLTEIQEQHMQLQETLEQLEQDFSLEISSVKQSLQQVQTDLSVLESQKLALEDQHITALSNLTADHLKNSENLKADHQTSKQQLITELDSLKSTSSESEQQFNQYKTDSDIKNQKLVNSLKQLELDNMSLQSQNLLQRQEYDQSKVNYSQKLEQIELTIRATLDVEKQATKQELEVLFEERILDQENQLREQHQADFLIQIQKVEAKLLKEFSQKTNKLAKDIMAKLKVVKADQIQLRKDALKNQKVSFEDLLKQFNDQYKVNSNQVQQKHQLSLKAQLSLVAELRQECQENKECLQEYKGLCNQLQIEKQQMTKASNQLYVSLKEAETELLKYYELHESSVGQLQGEKDRMSKDKAMVEEGMRKEMDTLRNQLIDVSTDLAKQKSRGQDLQVSLKQSKDTISGLVEKENALMDELQGKMGELGIYQDKWKQKVQEQKTQLADHKKIYDQLLEKYDVVCQSISQNTYTVKLEDELTLLRQTVQKREAEIKEIVRTLKKFSDDKKFLEQENAMLIRKTDNSEGHQNLQQKIQHHLKIKDENNKLREENYALQEQIRRKAESAVVIPQQALKDCMQMVETFDDIVDKILQAPGSVQLLKQMPQLNDTLRRAQQSTSTSLQAAANCKQKALVLSEIIANMSRRLQMTINQDSIKTPPNQPQQPQQSFKQPTQQRSGSGSIQYSATTNFRPPLPDKHSQLLQGSQQQPQQRQPPVQPSGNSSMTSNQTQQLLDKENKMTSATAFLNSITQRSNSGYM